MTSRSALVVVVSVAAVACGDAPEAPDAGESDAGACGSYRGHREGDTTAYLGIPFAAPPVGALRFAPPAAPVCPQGVIDADTYGARCPQLEDGVVVGDEDCLTLNVWVPDGDATDRPVMVWIHGGGNSIGSASDPLYAGDRLASAGDVVVVSIEYRLGALGFLVHPALSDESGDAVSGNYGLLDQIAALAWVRDHIATFTGDPGNVTIFGESAGGRDVCTLLATPASAGLFHRAIIESGACKFLQTHADAGTTGGEVAAALDCDGATDVAACLRAADADAIVDALPNDVGALSSSIFGPVVDGVVLLEQAEAAIAAGRHHPVPLIVGANADETSSSAPLTMNQATYEGLVRASYGATVGDQVLAEYAAVAPPRAAYVAVTSDARFICPSREIARSAAAGQTQPVHRYLFRHAPGPLGAVHGIELPYLFATFDAVLVNGQPYQPTATDLAISEAMQGYWTRFARTSDPAGAPAWPDWTATDPALVLDAAITVEDGAGAEHCDFWRPIYEAL